MVMTSRAPGKLRLGAQLVDHRVRLALGARHVQLGRAEKLVGSAFSTALGSALRDRISSRRAAV